MITRTVLDIAGRQHGAIGRSQLIDDVGLSRSAVHRATSSGRLEVMARGVYRIASAPETFEQRCSAATLFGHGDGFVGAKSAARLYGLRRMPAGRVQFTVPNRFRTQPPDWMDLRYTNWYSPSQHRRTIDGGIVIATPLRMLFGLAATLGQRRFDTAADDAWHLGLITPSEALDFLQRTRLSGKNGVRRMEHWLERSLVQERPSQSYLERDLIEELIRIGVPEPTRQHPITLRNGEVIHVDAAWPDVRFAAEPGHSWFHRLDGGQERDHRRDAGCSEVGWHILRLDEKMLDDVTSAARIVARALAQRRRDITPDSVPRSSR